MGNLPWGKIASITKRVANVALVGVQATEVLAPKFGTPTGTDKRDSVLELVEQELTDASASAGVNLAQNPQAMAAFGRFVDVYVDLHNVLAHEAQVAPSRERTGG